jgi:hypothetical protein
MTNGSEKYIEVVRFCGKLYDFLNGQFFGGELVKPVITVSPCERNKSFGWFTCGKVWCENAEIEGEYEINLAAQFLNRPHIETAATLLHEMCHQYAAVHNVQDCSRSGTYHNKVFKGIAEKHGLVVEKLPTIGYSKTTLSAESKATVEKFLSDELLIYRLPKMSGSRTKTCSTRKYVCPVCGISVRATKQVNIMCMDCDEPMQEEKE